LTFSVQKLAQSIRAHGSDNAVSGNPSTNSPSSDTHRLTVLSPPTATPASHKKSAGSSFASLYDHGATTLTVFLRAMHPKHYENLLSLLIEIAETCYGVKQAPKTKSRRKKRMKEEEVVRYVAKVQSWYTLAVVTQNFQPCLIS
jgi:hypothetical protein